MTIVNQNVKLYRGNTAVLEVALTEADGEDYDPTLDARIKWRMSRTWHSPEDETLVRKELNDGITVVSGGVEIALDAADTDFLPGLYYHELKVWDHDDVATAMTGTVVIKRAIRMGDGLAPEVTRLSLTAEVPAIVS